MRKGAILVIIAIVAVALAASGCGRQSAGRGGQPEGLVNQPQGLVNLQSADPIAELDALACPEGVDGALWAELKAALEEALVAKEESRFSNRDSLSTESRLESRDSGGRKFVSTPPTGEANRVNDLGITDNGDGTYTLTWHYRNLGDYDQNGKVAIADITPLAQHFGETWSEGEEDSLAAVIDGSGNGKVGIEDVTAIAQCFGVDCAGYRVQAAESVDGVYYDLGSTDLLFAVGDGRKRFSPAMSLTAGDWARVVPFDSAQVTGIPSDAVEVPIAGAWHFVTLDSIGNVGWYSSLAVVNGCPAVSYYDITNGDLKYVRANDENGSSWGTPLAVDYAEEVGNFTSLVVVNGNPAISYRDSGNRFLKYVRANDADGDSWGTRVLVDSSGNVGQYTSLAVVCGNPAISYYSQIDYDLRYIRSEDANGQTWGSPITLDSEGLVGAWTCLAVVDGYPAVSYWHRTNGYVSYIRADDPTGSSWNMPIGAADIGVSSTYSYTSLKVVGGNPAISCWDSANGDLVYIRSEDLEGAVWSTPVAVDTDGVVGLYSSLAVVNGNPAISYYDETNENLKFVQARDPIGAVWGAPQTVHSTGSVGRFTSLAALNDHPAICYYDETNGDLEFAIYY